MTKSYPTRICCTVLYMYILFQIVLLQNLSELLESEFSSSFTKNMKMDQVYLLCSWWLCSGLWMVVSSEPAVIARIVTPERDQKIGGRFGMICVASNLEEDHIVELRTEDNTLRWGNATVGGNDPRFMFDTKQTGIREITQEFNITDLQRSDDNEYICHVREPLLRGGTVSVANSTIRLRVYSSSESFPICSPDGPITVDEGAQLYMSCASDAGNPSIMISPFSSSQTWSTEIINGKSFRSLNLTINTSNDNLTFQCTISSVMNNSLTHSCFLGPIQVLGETDSTIQQISGLTTEANPAASITALAVGASVGGAAALVIILILVLICCKRGYCASLKSNTSSKASTELNSNPIISAHTISQSRVYENAALDYQDDTQDYEQETCRKPSQARINVRPEPEAGVLYARPSPSAKQTPTEYTPPVYAKPNKPQAPVDAANDQYDEQRYNNPVFDSADPDSSTAPLGEGTSAALKPTAMTPPFTKVPMKPQPYKPKDQRASDPRYGIAYHQGRGESTRPKSTPSLPSTDAHILTASENPCAEPSSPDGMTMYTEVSVPQIKTSTDRDTPSLPDHLVYADLNLEPDSSKDVGQPVISEEPVAVYARVMKNRPNSEETM
ncbi:uncharacterized protein LOC110979148 isoform X1 [Acanthaster planci]|uniref:Uncharacterized protein LOC110979148 isoform X1 n=1 Tax=Acanthaster planci TaxID=133434 RepID=A0A8B7YCW6_ACAPL|nr:uncharacterized protein LOC110979148 isoform X1 [Acanthaster planci]